MEEEKGTYSMNVVSVENFGKWTDTLSLRYSDELKRKSKNDIFQILNDRLTIREGWIIIWNLDYENMEDSFRGELTKLSGVKTKACWTKDSFTSRLRVISSSLTFVKLTVRLQQYQKQLSQ